MSAESRLQHAMAAARRRHAGIVALLALAAAAVIVTAAWRFGGAATMAWTALALSAVIVVLAWHGARALDDRWFARRLDRRADMEDSADLLFVSGTELNGLQVLQRERLRERLATGPAPDLRTAWPRRALLSAWIPALLLAAGLWLWPSSPPAPVAPAPVTVTSDEEAPTHTTLLAARLAIEPPAYTGLPARDGNELSDKAPTGSLLRWTLRFAPQPPSAEIVLHDGRRIVLVREGEDWTGEHRLDRSALYRLVPGGPLPLQDDRLHRLDAIADQPPQLRVITPERNLTLRTDGQRDWALSFEASDDYGLGNARLLITLAQGSGEQVTVSERRFALAGEGDGKQRRYTRRLDLAALGLAQVMT